jgi:hypothetical protein
MMGMVEGGPFYRRLVGPSEQGEGQEHVGQGPAQGFLSATTSGEQHTSPNRRFDFRARLLIRAEGSDLLCFGFPVSVTLVGFLKKRRIFH